ncbi:MAG: FHA domain-containing protein [Anaerolineae bacterium]
MRKLLVFLLTFGLLLPPTIGGRAQGQVGHVDLYPPDVAAFPTVAAYLDVTDSQGAFASGLTPEAVTVIEDGQPLPAAELSELNVPLQMAVALSPGPALDVRDKQGISRFQRLSQVLDGWVQNQPQRAGDDMSLVSIAGPVISHAKAADFRASWRAFQPNFRNSIPNLQSLSIALDLVAAPTAQPGMKRAVLFITPHMDDPNIDSLIQPLIQRARDSKIRVFVWFVDSELYFSTTSAAAFNTLATQTGGAMFGFSGTQQLPDLETYLAPLRRVYLLKYASKISAAGQHTLRLDVKIPAGTLTSAEQMFSLDVQPPNPIFVSPPAQITRQAPPEDPFNTEHLLPETQSLKIIVEFPDGHPRPLMRTRLYVDGQVVAENTTEPFDTFTWNLTSYTVSGEHQMVVEAVDSLGLSKTSIAMPVTVTVIQPPRGLVAFLAKHRQAIVFGAIGLAGLALAWVLLRGWLKFPSRRERRAARRAFEDPLTQPVPIPVEPTTSPRAKTRAARSAARFQGVDAPAFLIHLAADGEPATANPIPLAEKEVTFGTDPVQAMFVLDDPSISPLHARLKQKDDGSFVLYDVHSVAGTWVNYEPVPPAGHQLSHGDVVHFGQLMYRFQLRVPPSSSKPKILPKKPAA